jgi:hypothetical protein
MSFSSRVQTSWQLLHCSLRMLRDQPRLLLFPAVAFVGLIAIAAFFLTPILVLVIRESGIDHDWEAGAKRFEALFYAAGVVIYLVSMAVATFFNVAFYHEALRAFAGEVISLQRGWNFALGRLGPILSWSLLAGTVGLIIRAIEERLGWLGKIVMGLLGTAWSVAAVFAIPVIVRRPQSNPLAVLRDSAAMLKRTWGEALVGFVGLQLAGLILVGGAIIAVIALVFMALLLHLGWFPLVLLTMGAVGIVGVSLILSAATDIYRCALYVYASEGVVPEPYTAELMNAGWKVKKP